MSIRHPYLVASVLSIVILSSSPGLGSVGEDSSRVSMQRALQRLGDIQWTLALGITKVDAELRRVTGSGSGAETLLRFYRLQFDRQMAEARASARGHRALISMRDKDSIVEFAEEVDRLHLKALRLSSNLDSFGFSRVRDLEAKAAGVEQDPQASSGCYGSIAGTIRGPGGTLDGVQVTAETAEGVTAGSALTQGDGSYQIDSLLAGEEFYVVTSNADALIDEVWGDVECVGGVCDPTIGSPLVPSAGMTTSGIDFELAAGGRIGGAVTTQSGSIPLPITSVNIFDATGMLVTSAVADVDGNYLTETGLPSGTYHVVTASLLGTLDELYDNIPCPAGAGCDPTTGAGVVVTAPMVSAGIDFDLEAGGNITGNITDSSTALPLAGILVGIHDDSGLLIAFGASSVTGDYSILSGLPTGGFFAATGNLEGYVDELFDDIPCTGGLCTITNGLPIAVTLGATTGSIDFALSPGGTFSGRVSKAADGTPLGDVFILAHSSSGELIGTGTTDANGRYTLASGLGTGSYRATTLNPLGLADQLFEALPCPESVCDVSVGTPIAVTIGMDTPDIDFELVGDALGSCGFEGCSTCGLVQVP